MIKNKIKKMLRNPFNEKIKDNLIVHSCYHKVGTVWFSRVLSTVSGYYGLNYQQCEPQYINRKTNFFFDDHSLVDLNLLNNYKGSHMIRDPRDIIISGYFYHLKTHESWVHKKNEYGFKSYQEHLISLNQNDGILAEIKRASSEINHMASWNYNNPQIFEVKYEDIIVDEEFFFKKLFASYGFNKNAINKSLEIAMSFSLKKVKKKVNSHARSGIPGDWKKYFTNEHKKYFLMCCGDSLIKLDYESNNDW